MRTRMIRGSQWVVGCLLAMAAHGCSKSDPSSGAKQGKDKVEGSAPEQPQSPPAPSASSEAKEANAAMAAPPVEPASAPAEPAATEASAGDRVGERMVETVCAAVDPGDGKPPVLYGKWKEPLLADGEGEVMFHDVIIELAKHKPHAFPAVQRPVF